MSAESTRFIHVIYIASTPQKVFEAITRPEIASRYWGHELSLIHISEPTRPY